MRLLFGEKTGIRIIVDPDLGKRLNGAKAAPYRSKIYLSNSGVSST
jgi:hypothetical protein